MSLQRMPCTFNHIFVELCNKFHISPCNRLLTSNFYKRLNKIDKVSQVKNSRCYATINKCNFSLNYQNNCNCEIHSRLKDGHRCFSSDVTILVQLKTGNEDTFLKNNGVFSEVSRSVSSRVEKQKSVHSLAQTILKETEKVDVMAGSVPMSNVESLITDLLNLGFKSKSIRFLLSGRLWLLQNSETTLSLCDLLLSQEIAPDITCNVIRSIPYEYQGDALNIVTSRINKSLAFLRNFGFEEYDITRVLEKEASVILLDEIVIRNAVLRLKGYFPTRDTIAVICQSPNVLSEEYSSIQKKIEYAFFNMGYIQSDIVKSHLFSHSLTHIEDRHLFLKRAGIFQPVNKKLHPSLNSNPLLRRVVDSSVSSFVKLVSGATVEDLNVFKKMRRVERKLEGNDSTDDEDDDEDYNDFDDSAFSNDVDNDDVNFHKDRLRDN